jgi:hypothetical protein
LVLRQSLSVIALTFSLLGCSHSPTHPEGCSGDVDVKVDAERLGAATPVFTWTPRCGASDLTVTTVPAPGAAAAVVWQFIVPENAAMAPPIVFGAAPRNATVSVTPKMLVSGVTYRVNVTTTVGRDVWVGGGSATFTR